MPFSAAQVLAAALLSAVLSFATYVPPVPGPVIDPFALPNGPYGAGNRGLDYATTPGEPVGAIGDGVVVFAGPVAGARWVTVLHPDGLRSSYGPLDTIGVVPGDRVVAGAVLGTAGPLLHLGVRSGGTYLDPSTLFAGPGVHLVPLEDPVPGMVVGRVAGTLPARP
jgi:murein DD-endopeptidase MepM/ murein hydrolase activator NlpD